MADDFDGDDDFTWDDDDLDDSAASAPDASVPDASDTDDPESFETTPSRNDLEHKIKSAEGRYQKSEEKLQEFQQSIQSMQQQLESLNEKKPDPEPQDTGAEAQEVVPEGWSKDEWDDFKDDQPVTAELHEKQSRQVQLIREDLDDYRTKQDAVTHQEQFRNTVVTAHPDYDDLLKNERTQIEDFIEHQSNPIVKQAYQHVYEQGTADEVVQLVSDYKGVRPTKGQGKSSNSTADEALAITGRSASPNVNHRGTTDQNDFDRAWDDFPDELDD